MEQTPANFIRKELGGATNVAKRTGKTPSAVRMWVHRDVVPRSVWPDLLEAFPDLTLKRLKEIEAATRLAA